MQQRRVRLGDILDDYCPRERRVTNHVVAAMVEDEVKQTRCTTCDSDHVYKHARVPATRRKPVTEGEQVLEAAGALSSLVGSVMDESASSPEPAPALVEPAAELDARAAEDAGDVVAQPDEDWPVHRPLIRATLPRPEGQQPERKEPDFTHRQVEGRFNRGRNANRRGGKPHAGHPKGQSFSQFGNSQGRGSRHGQGGNSQRDGNRHGPSSGQHGSRPAGRGGGQHSPGRGRSRGR